VRVFVSKVMDNIKMGIENYPQTVKEVFVSASILILSWIILGILNYVGIESKFLFPLNFLTASLNGMQGGGIIGIVGGIIAKLTLLTMIVRVAIPIYKENFGKNKKRADIKGAIEKFIELLKKIFRRGLKLSGFILLGIGSAIIVYAFLTVNGNFENSFVIILALISTLRILVTQTSSILRFFTTIFRITNLNSLPMYSILLGLSFGFTISISMAMLLKNVLIAYSIGFLLVIFGYCVIIINRSRNRI